MLSRRSLFGTLAGLSALGAGGWAMLSPSRANAYYQGPVSDHFDGRLFFNPGGARPAGFGAFLRWKLFERPAAWPSRFPSPFAPDRPPVRFDGPGMRVVHVGHASFLIQTGGQAGGLNVLIDPVWVDYAGPFAFGMPHRVNPPGIAFDDLPHVDVVLVTHNHYDHMDVATIGRLWQRFKPRILTPLGNDTILKSEVPGLAAEAVDWDAAVELGGGVRVTAEPTQHWSARAMNDRRHALWASFVLSAGERTLYCVGDTGFGDGATFRRVRRRHPRIDAALLPIGAYEPRWFMRDSHMNPDEAVQAMELSGAARALGHHWGTFQLTNEPVQQPAEHLAAALTARGVPPERFMPLRPGEVVMV